MESQAREYRVKDILVGRADGSGPVGRAGKAAGVPEDDWAIASGWKAGRRTVRLGEAAIVGRTLRTLPALELNIDGLPDGEYALRARVWAEGGKGEAGRVAYLYGYHDASQAERYILLGLFMPRPKRPGLGWYPLTNADVRGGRLRVFLGPVVCRGSGENGRPYGWYSLVPADCFGAWDRIELTPVSPAPGADALDERSASRCRTKRRSFSAVAAGPKARFNVDVGGNIDPVMESVTIQSDSAPSRTPWLLTPHTPDYSSLRRLVGSIIRPGMDQAQRAEAIFNYFAGPVLFHTTRERERGRGFADTLKTLNVYGYGWCMVHATCYYSLARLAGLDVRVVVHPGHRWNHVRLGGQWRHFDNDLAMLFRDPAGGVPTLEYLNRHPEVVALNGDEFGQTPKGHPVEVMHKYRAGQCKSDAQFDGGHSMSFLLRPGEAIRRCYENEPWNVNLWTNPRQNYVPRFGSGAFEYRRRSFTKADLAGFRGAGGVRVAGGRIVAARAAAGGSFILPVRSPYVLRGAELTLKASGGVRVHVRPLPGEVPGEDWVEVPPTTGARGANWRGAALPIPDDIYGYDLKVILPPLEGPRCKPASVGGIELTSRFQCASETLPKLKSGRNTLTFRDGAAGPHRTRVRLEWTERTLDAAPPAGECGWGEVHSVQFGEGLFHPALAADAGGNLAVVWQRGARGRDSAIFIAFGPPGGNVFTAATRLSPAGLPAACPDVAFSADGDLWAAWQTGKSNILGTHVEARRLGARQIETSRRLCASRADVSARFPRLLPAGPGGLTAFWQEGHDHHTTVIRTLGRTGWGRTERIPGGLPAAAVGPDGTIHLVNHNIGMHYQQVPAGEADQPLYFSPAWTRPVGRADLAVAPDGTIHVVWGALRNAEWCSILLRTKRPGLAWSRAIPLSDPIHTDAKYPSIALAGEAIHVAWMDHRHGRPAVYWKRFDGRQWSADILLSTPGAAAMYPRLLASPAPGPGPKGANPVAVHAVWYEPAGEAPGIKLRTVDP